MTYIYFGEQVDDVSVFILPDEVSEELTDEEYVDPAEPVELLEEETEETEEESTEYEPEIEGMPYQNAESYLYLIALILFGAVCLTAIHRGFRALREAM